MKIHKVRIKNYKSIEDSGEVDLHRKINALAGKNNTGKSAFIETIYKAINGSFTEAFSSNSNVIHLVMEICVTPEELNLLYENVGEDYRISLEQFRLSIEHDIRTNLTCIRTIEMYQNDLYKPFYTVKGVDEYLIENLRNGRSETTLGHPHFLRNFFYLLKNKFVYISGSRYVPDKENYSLQNSLYIDGTNLNAYLFTLHNNSERIFDTILNSFTQIFSDVKSISTLINEVKETYISITFEGYDNPIPLSNCGSGFTHVLLFLCVLFTKNDIVVLFDEPQVFLHPSAEKAIYDLVNEIDEHQYIFTTHSPILINYPAEKHLVHVSKLNGASSFIQLEHIQEVLSDIGVSNSDFALSDKVIFVEGQTEELVIPMILSHFGLKQIGYNYRILNMKGTGNYFTKNSSMRAYKGKLDLILSGISESPIPYKIIIDADNKTDEKLLTLRESYGDSIIILDRREYENYFLDCYQELSEIINQYSSISTTDSDRIKSEVEQLLSLTKEKKLFPKDSTKVLKDVVGSEVLERLFESYSLHYNKIVHGMELTELVLNNTPEKLEFFKNELQDFIKG